MPAGIPPPEIFRVSALSVACDGSGEISPELGHPRVYLRIDEALGFVECGYCDRRFVLMGGTGGQQGCMNQADPRHFLYRGLDPDSARRLAAKHLSRCDDGELYLQYSASEAFGFDDGRLKTADYHSALGLRAARRDRRDHRLRPRQ